MDRRQFLLSIGTAACASSLVPTAAADEADPRADPVAGTEPEHARTVSVSALPDGIVGDHNTEVPVGNWIRHTNGWIMESGSPPDDDAPADPLERLEHFLETTTTVFTIRGETFVLDEPSDWEITPDPDDPEVGAEASFAYTIPPQPRHTTYEYGMATYDDETGEPVQDVFPTSNTITVVGR